MGRGKNKARRHSNAVRRRVSDAPHPNEIGEIKSEWERREREAKLEGEVKHFFDQEKREIELSHQNTVIDAETDISEDKEAEVNIDEVIENMDKARRKFKESPLDFSVNGGWVPVPGVEFFPRYPKRKRFDMDPEDDVY